MKDEDKQNSEIDERKTVCSLVAYLCGAAEVIVIDLFYRLEVDHALQLGLMFVCRKENNGLVRD